MVVAVVLAVAAVGSMSVSAGPTKRVFLWHPRIRHFLPRKGGKERGSERKRRAGTIPVGIYIHGGTGWAERGDETRQAVRKKDVMDYTRGESQSERKREGTRQASDLYIGPLADNIMLQMNFIYSSTVGILQVRCLAIAGSFLLASIVSYVSYVV